MQKEELSEKRQNKTPKRPTISYTNRTCQVKMKRVDTGIGEWQTSGHLTLKQGFSNPEHVKNKHFNTPVMLN